MPMATSTPAVSKSAHPTLLLATLQKPILKPSGDQKNIKPLENNPKT
jgi:hypothetical protein